MDLQQIKRSLRSRTEKQKKGRQWLGTSDVDHGKSSQKTSAVEHASIRSVAQISKTDKQAADDSLNHANTELKARDIPKNHDVHQYKASSPLPAFHDLRQDSDFKRSRSPFPRLTSYSRQNEMLFTTNKSTESIPQTREKHELRSPLQAAAPRTFFIDDAEDADDFDLYPPPQGKGSVSVVDAFETLLSAEHLVAMLHSRRTLQRLCTFLVQYQPQDVRTLMNYLDSVKAIKALEYVHAVVESALSDAASKGPLGSNSMAKLGAALEESREKSFNALLNVTLPAFITHCLVNSVNRVTMKNVSNAVIGPVEDKIEGLNEAFCITDPHQDNNPIIYVSEAFHKVTGYGREFVIGRNCRFLQGPQTSLHTLARIREAVNAGKEICETMLNFRRDGQPFINVLMVAPLHDRKGKIKYHIGAQVNASCLIEHGNLTSDLDHHTSVAVTKRLPPEPTPMEQPSRNGDGSGNMARKGQASALLNQLCNLRDLELSVTQSKSSTSSGKSGDKDPGVQHRQASQSRPLDSVGVRETRQDSHKESKAQWDLQQLGSSGNLPGVYQSYLLMRPSPSLKIIFVSPSLQRWSSLIQSNFMAHVYAPSVTTATLRNAFATGTAVTAHIVLKDDETPESNSSPVEIKQTQRLLEETSHESEQESYWLTATPLFGSDAAVGVWMVVLISRPARAFPNPLRASNAITAPNGIHLGNTIPNRPGSSQGSSTPQTPQNEEDPSLGARRNPWQIFPPRRTSSRTLTTNSAPK